MSFFYHQLVMTEFDRRKFLKSAATLSAAAITTSCASSADKPAVTSNRQGESVMGLTVPAIDNVRVGFIGVGQRGSQHVRHFCALEGVTIAAICDTHAAVLDRSIDFVTSQGLQKPARYTGSDLAYRDMLVKEQLDMVIISTPWSWHTPMSVDAMESGSHAFVEVPAATSIEECWQLVDVAERTGKNCMMMENVNYGRDELMVLNMVRQGLFGELLHGEAAYIHDLRWQMKELTHKTGSWRTHWHTRTNGNLYPTHGLGPVSQYMNINRGDRFDYLTSVSSPALGRAAYAQKEFPQNHERNQLKYIAGDMNTTIIKTKLGRSIMVQHDTSTPRPYSRHNLIQGSNGVFAGFPNRIALESRIPELVQQNYDEQHQRQLEQWHEQGESGRKPRPHSFHSWDHDMGAWRQLYDHPLWIKMGQEALKNGGPRWHGFHHAVANGLLFAQW